MDVFGGLNEQQSAAVRATEGFVRVIAGAGSGKTRLLVNRYAYLVDDYGIDPANILCVTFTNKAAAEMRRRINFILGEGYDTSLICTYHGFCARLIREDPDKLYLPKDFRIIDESTQRSMLEEIYQKYDLRLENASFGAGTCAERVALGSALASGEREFEAICVYADRTVTPCGICRQALSEFGDMAVICAGDDGGRREYMLSELLPAAFSDEALH